MFWEPHFFVCKAHEYIEAIDSLLPQLASTNGVDRQSWSEVKILRKVMSDLKLKIKLLFKEFDKGELFFDKCICIDEADFSAFSDTEKLLHYRHTLSLFVEHLQTYRPYIAHMPLHSN